MEYRRRPIIGTIRSRMGCSRVLFAVLLGINPSSINMVERKRRFYSPKARANLKLIESLLKNPLPADNYSTEQILSERIKLKKTLQKDLRKFIRQKENLHYLHDNMLLIYNETHQILADLSLITLPETHERYLVFSGIVERLVQIHRNRLKNCDEGKQFENRMKIAALDFQIQMVTTKLESLKNIEG